MSNAEEFTTREEIISALKAQEILDSNISELESLCRKTSLRPRKDQFGNVYFSRNDVDILKKVKELYSDSRKLQEIKEIRKEDIKPDNVFSRAKARIKAEVQEIVNLDNKNEEQQPEMVQKQEEKQLPTSLLEATMNHFEENIITKIEELLSEKMDGLDEVILELIRSKGENENLRQKLNEMNKENYTLKKELSSYKLLGLGLYVKGNNQDF